jgi:hypothetical protein
MKKEMKKKQPLKETFQRIGGKLNEEAGPYNLNQLFIQFILKDLKGATKRATEIGQILKREMAKGHPYIADVSPEEVSTKLKNIWKAYSIGLPKADQELLK